MVNVNRNALATKDLDRLLKQFDSALLKFDESSVHVFLNDLLGKEERLTIAKRFAAIILITEGCTMYKTSQLLKLSPTTVRSVFMKIETGQYKTIVTLLKKNKKNYFSILETIDSILHLGGILPHRVGLERYRGFRKYSS